MEQKQTTIESEWPKDITGVQKEVCAWY